MSRASRAPEQKTVKIPTSCCATGGSNLPVKQTNWETLHHADTHLPRSEFPVCRDAVRRVHEDFGDAQSFLDGLQLEPQQVKVNAASLKYLTRADKQDNVKEKWASGKNGWQKKVVVYL